MPLRNLVWLLIVPGMVALGMAIGYSAPHPDRDYDRIRQIVEVIDELDKHYVRELSEEEKQKLVEDMINGGLKKLDPNAAYFNEKQLKEFEKDNEGNFAGVGITLNTDPTTKRLRVEYPMAGTPAYEAGVIAGDLILKVDGEDTTGWTNADASKKIKGEPDTKVTLTLGRGDKEIPVTLTRALVALHPVAGVSRRADDPTRWNWFIDPQNKIALVRISLFNELTAKELKDALGEIEDQGGKALILDLRDNPGGLLSQAIEVSDLFLTEGVIVTTKDRRDKEKTTSAKGAGTVFLPAELKPMAVLVNDQSASASEIVAAALQDHKRAVIVGERTFGKGSVQTTFRLAPSQKSAVKFTTQTWWRPSGKNIDKPSADRQRLDEWGVTPDEGLAVPTTLVEKARYESEMDKLKYTAGKPSVVGPNPPPPNVRVPRKEDGTPLWDESKPFEDRQLNRALEQIRNKLMGIGAAPRRATPGPTPA